VLVASVVMAAFLVIFTPELNTWVEQSLIERTIHLMKLIPSAVLVYFFALFCIGLRARDIRVQTNSEPL